MKSYFQMTPEEREEYKKQVAERMAQYQNEDWVTVFGPGGATLTIPRSIYEKEQEREKAKREQAKANRKRSPILEDGKTLDMLVFELPTEELRDSAYKMMFQNRIARVPDEESWAQIKKELNLE